MLTDVLQELKKLFVIVRYSLDSIKSQLIHTIKVLRIGWLFSFH